MGLSDYLLTLVKTYNPNQYHKLLERSSAEIFGFFLITLCIAFSIFFLIVIPISARYILTVDERLGPVSALNCIPQLNTTQEVTLFDHPHVVLNPGANESASRTLLITQEGIRYPTFYWFGDSTIPWERLLDFKAHPASNTAMIMIFLLPSFMFWVVAWALLKMFLLFSILILLATILPRLFGYRISFGESSKIALLTSPSILFFDVALSPIAPLFWWGALLATIYFTIIVLLIIEPKRKEFGSREAHDIHAAHHTTEQKHNLKK